MGHFADAELAFSLRVDRGIAHPEYTVSNLVDFSNNEVCRIQCAKSCQGRHTDVKIELGLLIFA